MAERELPERAKALFPRQNEQTFAAAIESLRQEMERANAAAHDPKSALMAFKETVRSRESIFRFSEIRTKLTPNPQQLAEELFRLYVRMEAPASAETALMMA